MADTYDPNCEATNPEKVVAGHWELLRRNVEFQELSRRWVQSEVFRQSHALSPHYHDMQNHTPRCAWDWMLTAAQRVRLAKFQIDKRAWLHDPSFNFGPILCRHNFSPAALTVDNLQDFWHVVEMPDAPAPITLAQSWDSKPEAFKKQFRLAYAPPAKIGEINERLHELANLLRVTASKLANGDPLKEMQLIAHHLFKFGDELMELAEFSKVFKIPRRRYSEARFNSLLGEIRASFKAADLLWPTKTYDTHKSYQGTDEDWRWFLVAEQLGLDVRKSSDCYKLAEIYCEDLRRRARTGNAPCRTKAHGHTGTKFSSKVIKARRSAVKRHVLSIEKWIREVFPRHTPEPRATES